jgi:hypothetical protein
MPAKKKTKSEIGKLIEKLIAETHETFAATGQEQAIEISRERVREVLGDIWPSYIAKELASALGIQTEASPEKEDEDDD